MTSNCGVSDIYNRRETLGFGSTAINTDNPDYEQMKDIIMANVRKKFKPEFINRIDVITVFHSLTNTDLTNIATIMLTNLNKRLKEKGIDIKVTKSALNYLVEKGSSPEYGARPLKRVIQQDIEDRLTDGILSGEIDRTQILVDFDGNNLNFSNTTD